MHTTRITITRVVYPQNDVDVNAELQYLAGSLGLFNQRDKDKSKFRIFIALLRSLRRNQHGLTSDDLAERLGLTRATVVHHLNALAESGIIDHAPHGYVLRVETLQELVQKIRRDVNATLAELEDVARRCDEKLGLS